MKKIFLAILFVQLFAGMAWAQSFEGQVVYERLLKQKNGALSETRRTEYHVKGNAVRVDHYANMQATTPLNSYIADKNGRLLAIAGGEKDKTATETALLPVTDAVWSASEVRKTGNTKTILGQKCFEVVTKYDHLVITAWVAPNSVDYNNLLAPLNSIQEGLLPVGTTGIPLEVKVSSYDLEVFTLRAVRYTPKVVDAGIFRAPAGLQVQKY